MEINQSSTNQNLTESEARPKKTRSRDKLLVTVAISVLLSAVLTGSVVYFWQKSVGEKEITTLEQKVSSLEEQVSVMDKTETIPQPTSVPKLSSTPISKPNVNLKTYRNEKYQFRFNYPQNWILNDTYQDPNAPISLTNIASGHTISIQVYAVTGFGYCYKYSEEKEIIVGGKTANTADGVGNKNPDCSPLKENTNRGNTFVLIPIDHNNTTRPIIYIHISYDYPLAEKDLAKYNLERILSTFKFTD